MTMMPPQSPLEFFLYDPLGTILTIAIFLLFSALLTRFVLDYPTMQANINLANICIGGACK
jgi:hypothetical protein